MRKSAVCLNPACPRAGKVVAIRARGLCSGCHRNATGKRRGPITLFPVGCKGRKWTNAEETFLRDKRLADWSYRTIAKALKRPCANVRRKAWTLGLTRPDGKSHGKGGHCAERQAARIAFIHTHGRYPDRNGNPGRKVPKWFLRAHSDADDRVEFGVKTDYQKWTDEDNRTVREMLTAGHLPRDIAERLGRTLVSVRGAVKRIRAELKAQKGVTCADDE